MKKLLLVGTVVLLLATETAHAQYGHVIVNRRAVSTAGISWVNHSNGRMTVYKNGVFQGTAIPIRRGVYATYGSNGRRLGTTVKYAPGIVRSWDTRCRMR